jgi:hypothetical protein
VANLREQSFFTSALRITIEPAGWFLVWTGLDQIFSLSRKSKPEYDFMSRMAYAQIEFLSF